MKILFSPSESKNEHSSEYKFSSKSLIFPEIFGKREEVLLIYGEFLRSATSTEISKMFGVKDEAEVEKYKRLFFEGKTIKAIRRYDGTAYKALGYDELPQYAQNYIDENTVIFSNLFGPVLAKDSLPYYKLKQGVKIGTFATETHYKKHFSVALNEMLKDEFIIDLRAGFYEKFYTLKQPYITFKFLQGGKAVSHFVKAYRGTVLKELALQNICTKEQLGSLVISGVKLMEIVRSGLKEEFVFEVE